MLNKIAFKLMSKYLVGWVVRASVVLQYLPDLPDLLDDKKMDKYRALQKELVRIPLEIEKKYKKGTSGYLDRLKAAYLEFFTRNGFKIDKTVLDSNNFDELVLGNFPSLSTYIDSVMREFGSLFSKTKRREKRKGKGVGFSGINVENINILKDSYGRFRADKEKLIKLTSEIKSNLEREDKSGAKAALLNVLGAVAVLGRLNLNAESIKDLVDTLLAEFVERSLVTDLEGKSGGKDFADALERNLGGMLGTNVNLMKEYESLSNLKRMMEATEGGEVNIDGMIDSRVEMIIEDLVKENQEFSDFMAFMNATFVVAKRKIKEAINSADVGFLENLEDKQILKDELEEIFDDNLKVIMSDKSLDGSLTGSLLIDGEEIVQSIGYDLGVKKEQEISKKPKQYEDLYNKTPEERREYFRKKKEDRILYQDKQRSEILDRYSKIIESDLPKEELINLARGLLLFANTDGVSASDNYAFIVFKLFNSIKEVAKNISNEMPPKEEVEKVEKIRKSINASLILISGLRSQATTIEDSKKLNNEVRKAVNGSGGLKEHMMEAKKVIEIVSSDERLIKKQKEKRDLIDKNRKPILQAELNKMLEFAQSAEVAAKGFTVKDFKTDLAKRNKIIEMYIIDFFKKVVGLRISLADFSFNELVDKFVEFKLKNN